MALQVEEGKRYTNAMGQIVGPARFEPGGEIAFMPDRGAGYCVFVETGMVQADENDKTPLDLVSSS